MQNDRGHTRIITRDGTNYIVLESFEEVETQFTELRVGEGAFLSLTNVPAQTAFPPTRMFLRVADVSSVQTVSHEAWVWQQQAEERQYARALRESPQEQIAEAQAALADWLKEQIRDG